MIAPAVTTRPEVARAFVREVSLPRTYPKWGRETPIADPLKHLDLTDPRAWRASIAVGARVFLLRGSSTVRGVIAQTSPKSLWVDSRGSQRRFSILTGEQVGGPELPHQRYRLVSPERAALIAEVVRENERAAGFASEQDKRVRDANRVCGRTVRRIRFRRPG